MHRLSTWNLIKRCNIRLRVPGIDDWIAVLQSDASQPMYPIYIQ